MNTSTEQKLEKIRAGRDLSVSDVCSIDELTVKDIELIFDLAREFKKSGTEKLTLLKGTTVFNAFFEDSTRTRSSFELAGKNLGADTINISGSNTSLKKGETMLDTTETLNALGAKALIVRTSKAGMPQFLAQHVRAAIISAGDGWHEHPSQALLDTFTITEKFGSLKGKNILITGDILHSRVAGSLMRAVLKLGGALRIAAPATFVPRGLEKVFPCKVFFDVEEALKGADVVYTLRVQEERGANGFIPTLREFSKAFGVSEKRFALANKDALLMHAGPVIRDIEVHSALVPHSRSMILTQVENGLAVRKALLWLLCDRCDKRVKDFQTL